MKLICNKTKHSLHLKISSNCIEILVLFITNVYNITSLRENLKKQNTWSIEEYVVSWLWASIIVVIAFCMITINNYYVNVMHYNIFVACCKYVDRNSFC